MLSNKLNFTVAHHALLHFFNSQYWSPTELALMNDFFLTHHSDNIDKLKLRLISEENNDWLVASFLADSPFHIRHFLFQRYRLDLSFVKISFNLHAHPNALQKWRDKSLADISALLNFQLSSHDIFSRNKVETLVAVLNSFLSFLFSFPLADSSFISTLQSKLANFQELLFVLKQYLYSNSTSPHVRIIRLKILRPYLSIKELENVSGFSHSSIHHHFNIFQSESSPD